MCNWTAWWFKVEGLKSKEEIADTIADLAVHAVGQQDTKRHARNDPQAALRILREDLAYLERLIIER